MIATAQFTISVISDGPQGVSVTNVIPQYRLSDSSTSLTGSGDGYTWSTTQPKVGANQYLWTRNQNTLSNGNTVYSTATCNAMITDLVFNVDRNTNSITQKVWESDITTKINEYDGSTGKSIRDRVTATETDLTGIHSSVSSMQSDIATKADGSTVTTLQNDYSDFKQTMSGFKTTVESNYAQLKDLKVSGENLYIIKDSVKGFLNASTGVISAQNATYKEMTSDYIPVVADKPYVIQSWATPTTVGESQLAYQFFTEKSASGKIGTRTGKYGKDTASGVEIAADGSEHLTYNVYAPTTAKYLRVSYRAYDDGRCMVEQATLPSEYGISDQDIANNVDSQVSAVRTIAEQNADHFSWLVQDGSTSSSVTYTANALTAMANQIDLTGKVTFNSLNSAVQTRITDVESAASTAGADATAALNGMKAYTGTCSTAAGTAAKVVSCSDSAFALTNGTIIRITFSTASTADAPTLNVNSKGAKAIYFDNGVTSSTNRFGWQAGSTITFQYNGTYWVVLHYKNLEYFTCSTAAGTAAKATTNPNGTFVLCKGTTISVYFSTENTANALTLNVGATGAYAVYYKNAVTSASNKYTWDAGVTLTFIYNGSYWHVNDGGSLGVKEYASGAVQWVNTNGVTTVTASDILKTWTGDATLATTTIDGGYIKTHTIESEQLATDAIMSSNYTAITGSNFSATGAFLDLATGTLYMPNFGVNGTTGEAFFNGTINATAGKIGEEGNSYWEIGTIYDTAWGDYAGLISHGNALIQTGLLTLSDTRLSSQNSGNYTSYNNVWYDYGLQVPDRTATGDSKLLKDNFLYIRKNTTQPTESTVEADWQYLFKVDKDGTVYENGVKLSEKYASIDGVTGTYLPLSGGTVSGNLTVTGTLTATASSANQVTGTLSINGKSYNGSQNVTVGAIGAAYGGTGQTSLVNSANALINALTIGSSTPVDADYYVSQYVDGGSSHTTFHRRPMSALWTYIKGKIDAVYDHSSYRTLDNNTFDSINATDISTGNLIVSGAARFTNGIYGNLTGTASEATHAASADNATNATNATSASTASKVANSLKIQLNGGTTEGTNQFTFDGSAAKNINITKSSIGLGNVENTALSSWAGSANLTTTKVGTLAAAATKGVDTSVASNSTSTNVPTSKAVATLVTGYAVKGLSSGTTSGHFVTWGANGYTVADSGYSAGQAVSSLASNNDGKLVLTYLDGTTSAPIEVKIIGSSGSSVSYADALNVNGTAVGSATQPVYIDNQGKPQTANKIPKLNNASSDSAFYAPTTAGTSGYYLKSSGSGAPTWAAFSKSTVGLGNVDNTADANKNVLTATKFASAQSVTLTGDTTGTASSTGGWSLVTTTNKLSYQPQLTTQDAIDSFIEASKFMAATFKTTDANNIGMASNDGMIMSLAWQSTAYGAQLALDDVITGVLKIRGRGNSVWGDWRTVIHDGNYTNYTVTKTGTGASGTWKISITGNAATATKATQDGDGSTISSTYAKLSGATFTGAVSGTSFAASSYITVNSGNSGTTGGLALYGTNPTTYGIAMRGSGTGKHGYVQGDWATYFFMTTTAAYADTRGWIFKNQTANAGVASISTNGNAAFSGSVTVGGNVANDSGCRMVMNTSTNSLDFVFN